MTLPHESRRKDGEASDPLDLTVDWCEHTRQLLARHLVGIDEQITRLQQARARILDLQVLATSLDPTDCTDPHRCQVIDAGAAVDRTLRRGRPTGG